MRRISFFRREEAGNRVMLVSFSEGDGDGTGLVSFPEGKEVGDEKRPSSEKAEHGVAVPTRVKERLGESYKQPSALLIFCARHLFPMRSRHMFVLNRNMKISMPRRLAFHRKDYKLVKGQPYIFWIPTK
jgi:hypothetical protein